MRMQTHFQHEVGEMSAGFVAYEDLLRIVSPFPKIEPQLEHRLVCTWRQLRHHIDDRALYFVDDGMMEDRKAMAMCTEV